jgi:hypothetical protein
VHPLSEGQEAAFETVCWQTAQESLVSSSPAAVSCCQLFKKQPRLQLVVACESATAHNLSICISELGFRQQASCQPVYCCSGSLPQVLSSNMGGADRRHKLWMLAIVVVLLSASHCQARPSFMEPDAGLDADYFTRAARQMLVSHWCAVVLDWHTAIPAAWGSTCICTGLCHATSLWSGGE